MVKGFSESEVKNDKPIKDLEKENKGLASFLKGKNLLIPYQVKSRLIYLVQLY